MAATAVLGAGADPLAADTTVSIGVTVAPPSVVTAAFSSLVAAAGPNGPRPALVELALEAAACAARRGAIPRPGTLTIIDYSRPSTEERLWVFDLASSRLLYRELVAHGRGTGENFARWFSNEPESHQSSLGLFVTEEAYTGLNGYSLRLRGLEPGINDRARDRAIVIHGAPYVDAGLASRQGRLGRSWGCPALRLSIARELIDRIKGGGLLFSYYPNRDWLDGSTFLGGCGEAAE
jgi:hypothetical protein